MSDGFSLLQEIDWKIDYAKNPAKLSLAKKDHTLRSPTKLQYCSNIVVILKYNKYIVTIFNFNIATTLISNINFNIRF